MIIQIRGTSGSGKSTVMREVMKGVGDNWWPHTKEGRKRPLFYQSPEGFYVLGHYESPCGGCDTIGSARQIYDQVMEMAEVLDEQVMPVHPVAFLCEGLLMSEDVKWASQLAAGGLRVLYLTTPVDVCIERIKKRRKEAGNDKLLKEDNTRNRVAVIERSRVKLSNMGVLCRRASSSQASGIILGWLEDAKKRVSDKIQNTMKDADKEMSKGANNG